MHYVNLDASGHGGNIDGARVILGCVAAASVDVVTFRSATGSLHSVSAYGGDCTPGKYAIAGLIEIWGILGVFDDAEKALAELPAALRQVARASSPAGMPAYKDAPLLDESKMPADASEVLAQKHAAAFEGLARAQAELADPGAAHSAVKLMDREADSAMPGFELGAATLTELGIPVAMASAKPATKKPGKAT